MQADEGSGLSVTATASSPASSYEQLCDGHGDRDILTDRVSGDPWPAVPTRDRDIDSNGLDAVSRIGEPGSLKDRPPFAVGGELVIYSRRKSQLRRRGVSAVEAAVVYPITILLLLGTVVLGLGVFRYQQLQSPGA